MIQQFAQIYTTWPEAFAFGFLAGLVTGVFAVVSFVCSSNCRVSVLIREWNELRADRAAARGYRKMARRPF